MKRDTTDWLVQVVVGPSATNCFLAVFGSFVASGVVDQHRNVSASQLADWQSGY